jgi:hypothetical protein
LRRKAGELLAAVTEVVGEHRYAIAAGGWTRMRSVRETKTRQIPRLRFCPVEQPGARGAALFAACALGDDSLEELARRFALSADAPYRSDQSASELGKEQRP